jgi:hypothetical protein
MTKKRSVKLLDSVLNPLGLPTYETKSSSIYFKEAAKETPIQQGQPEPGIKPLSMAPRLNTLDSKTVYFVDVGFGGGYEFFMEMQDWFSQKMPGVKTVLKRKTGNMFMDDPDLWAEIKEKGNAVVFGVGG